MTPLLVQKVFHRKVISPKGVLLIKDIYFDCVAKQFIPLSFEASMIIFLFTA